MLGFLLLITHLTLTNAEGISCYQCSATAHNPGILPCSKFDWSQKFEVSCPMSTFCLRKTFTVPLGNGEIQSIEMGCASQTKEVRHYNKAARQWHEPSFEIVDEVYKDGCSLAEDTGRPGKPAEYCYCSYYLCNGSDSINKVNYPFFALHTIVSMFFVWVKFCGI